MAARTRSGEGRAGSRTGAARAIRGFTLIELMVCLAIVATMLVLATPRYFGTVDQMKASVLRYNLTVTRDAIDKYKADRGRFPDALSELVEHGYLQSLPVDPVTGRADTWVFVKVPQATGQGIRDLRSGSDARTEEGEHVSAL